MNEATASRLEAARTQVTGKVAAIVKVRAAAGRADELVDVVHQFFERQWNLQDDTELFVVGRSLDDPDEFFLVSAYRDVDALEAHLRHPQQSELVPKFRECITLLEPVFLDLVRTKGLGRD